MNKLIIGALASSASIFLGANAAAQVAIGVRTQLTTTPMAYSNEGQSAEYTPVGLYLQTRVPGTKWSAALVATQGSYDEVLALTGSSVQSPARIEGEVTEFELVASRPLNELFSFVLSAGQTRIEESVIEAGDVYSGGGGLILNTSSSGSEVLTHYRFGLTGAAPFGNSRTHLAIASAQIGAANRELDLVYASGTARLPFVRQTWRPSAETSVGYMWRPGGGALALDFRYRARFLWAGADSDENVRPGLVEQVQTDRVSSVVTHGPTLTLSYTFGLPQD